MCIWVPWETYWNLGFTRSGMGWDPQCLWGSLQCSCCWARPSLILSLKTQGSPWKPHQGNLSVSHGFFVSHLCLRRANSPFEGQELPCQVYIWSWSKIAICYTEQKLHPPAALFACCHIWEAEYFFFLCSPEFSLHSTLTSDPQLRRGVHSPTLLESVFEPWDTDLSKSQKTDCRVCIIFF